MHFKDINLMHHTYIGTQSRLTPVAIAVNIFKFKFLNSEMWS